MTSLEQVAQAHAEWRFLVDTGLPGTGDACERWIRLYDAAIADGYTGPEIDRAAQDAYRARWAREGGEDWRANHR